MSLALGDCPPGRPGSLWDFLQPLAFGYHYKALFFHINTITPLCTDAQSHLGAAAASPRTSYAGGVALAICFPNVMATPFQELYSTALKSLS